MNKQEFKEGDLVNLYVYSPHDSELACTPLQTGIFLDYDHESFNQAYLVLIDGEIKSCSKQWWKIQIADKIL